MSAQHKTAVVLGTAALAFAAMTMFQPHLPNDPTKTPQQIQQEQGDKDLADLSDSDENQKGRYRDESNDLLDADHWDRLRPGEHRPPKVPRFRFIIKQQTTAMLPVFSRYPRVGDEVRTTKPTTTSMWGGTVRSNTRAVVVAVGWTRTTIKLDTGNGFHTATVPTSTLRVTRRNIGERRFTQRGQTMHLARLGVAITMLAPFAVFTGQYVLANGTTDGLIETIAIGIMQSALDTIALGLANPIGTGIYLLVGWLLWRFAFPKQMQ